MRIESRIVLKPAAVVNTERLNQLDGLRGIAAVIVVISHCANAGLLPSFLGRGFGQMGVTLFYALSAFLLGRLYLQSEFNAHSLKRYTVSRVSRVLPLFYFVLAVTLGVYLVSGDTFYDIESATDFILNAALVQGTSVLWSIPVELQYYLVFAGLWWLYARRGIGLTGLIILGIGVQAVVAVAIWALVPEVGSFNLAFWGHIFLCGLVLSQLSYAKLPDRFALLQTAGLVAIFLLALPEVRRNLGIPTLPNFADPLTAGVPLLILYLALRQAVPLKFLEAKVLGSLGAISFGLYLIHKPVITVVRDFELLKSVPGLGFVVVMLISLLLSWAVRRLVEVPAQAMMKAYFSTDAAQDGVAGSKV